MRQLQLRDDQYVDVLRIRSVFEMDGHSFLDVQEQLIHRAALREHVFTDAACAPELAVVVDFDFYKRRSTRRQS